MNCRRRFENSAVPRTRTRRRTCGVTPSALLCCLCLVGAFFISQDEARAWVPQDASPKADSKEEKTLRIFQLQYVPPATIANTVQALDPTLNPVCDENTNSLIMSVTDEQYRVVADLILRLDEPARLAEKPRTDYTLFYLKHASAEPIAEILNIHLDDIRVTSDARTNSVLVGAVETRLKEVNDLLEKLDQPVSEEAAAAQQVTVMIPDSLSRSVRDAWRAALASGPSDLAVQSSREGIMLRGPQDQVDGARQLLEQLQRQEAAEQATYGLEVVWLTSDPIAEQLRVPGHAWSGLGTVGVLQPLFVRYELSELFLAGRVEGLISTDGKAQISTPAFRGHLTCESQLSSRAGRLELLLEASALETEGTRSFIEASCSVFLKPEQWVVFSATSRPVGEEEISLRRDFLLVRLTEGGVLGDSASSE